MHLCYIDESGTSSIPGNTSHFILAGLSIPIGKWKKCDEDISKIKSNYDLKESEIHTAWIARKYFEQSKISNFEKLSWSERRSRIQQYRNRELLRLQKIPKKNKLYRQTKKNYSKTEAYIHLMFEERTQLLVDLATTVANWDFARLFADCVDKGHFDPSRQERSIDEFCLEQIVSRFEQYLSATCQDKENGNYGLLIHDNNETVAKNHTRLMKEFYRKGTPWTPVKNIIETPLFVDSQLTSMVQIADLCSYALRRYVENSDYQLFSLIFKRADRKGSVVVGVRHFTNLHCNCHICSAHRS